MPPDQRQPHTHHGPLQRLLDCNAASTSPSLYDAAFRRCWSVSSPDNLAEWHSQQRDLPAATNALPLAKGSSLEFASANRCSAVRRQLTTPDVEGAGSFFGSASH
jgi:hypothetical protein